MYAPQKQQPGTGQLNPLRNYAPELQEQGTQLVSTPVLIQEPTNMQGRNVRLQQGQQPVYVQQMQYQQPLSQQNNNNNYQHVQPGQRLPHQQVYQGQVPLSKQQNQGRNVPLSRQNG